MYRSFSSFGFAERFTVSLVTTITLLWDLLRAVNQPYFCPTAATHRDAGSSLDCCVFFKYMLFICSLSGA